MLAIGAGHPVDRAQRAHAVRHDECRDAVEPRVAVRSVRGVQLVTCAYPLERAGVFHLLQQHEVEVARHAERMVDAGLPKSPEEKLPDGHCQALAPGTDRGTLSHHRHLDPPRPGTSVLTGAPAVLVVALTPC